MHIVLLKVDVDCARMSRKSRRPSIKDTGSNRFELIEKRSRANRFKVDSPTEIVERIMLDERSEKERFTGDCFTETFVRIHVKNILKIFRASLIFYNNKKFLKNQRMPFFCFLLIYDNKRTF